MKKLSTSTTFIVAYFALGGAICGYVLSIISGAASFIKNDFNLSTAELSEIMGVFLLGGIVANILFLFSDKFGRKLLVFVTLILYIIGILLFTTAHSSTMLYVGRLVQGISILLGSMAFTVYLTEVAPTKHRGKMVTVFQLSWTAGMFIANFVNMGFEQSGNWQLMFNVVLFVPVLLIIFTGFLPQTPRWLVLRGRKDEAKELLRNLNKKLSSEDLEHEFNMILQAKDKTKDMNIFKELTQKKFFKPILLVIAILVLTQLTGINAILQASATMLKDTGLTSDFMSIFGAILISGVNFVLTIGTIMYVDKIGRIKLLKIGTGGYCITMLILSAVFFLLPVGPLKGYCMLIGLMVGVGFLAFGPTGVIYVIVAEILPNSVRSTGLVIGGFASMIIGFFFISKFLVIATKGGYGILFLVLAICAIIYFFFSIKLLPETKGKTLEEIEAIYEE